MKKKRKGERKREEGGKEKRGEKGERGGEEGEEGEEGRKEKGKKEERKRGGEITINKCYFL